MTKVVINKCFGGFSLSDLALERYNALSGKSLEHSYSIERDDPFLVQIVEILGKAADGAHASLKIVEVPDDISWNIDEYDGQEHIAEQHRTWG